MLRKLLGWRKLLALVLLASLGMGPILGGMVLMRDAFNDSQKLPTQSSPSLDELNGSIRLGQQFASALYKPLPSGQAVQSEASGVPFRVYFPSEHKWVLLGEDGALPTAITNASFDSTHDRYEVRFASPVLKDALLVRVNINWRFSDSQYQVRLQPVKVKEPAELWIGDTRLAEYRPASLAQSEHNFSNADQSLLRDLRFTVRHATQEAYLYWSSFGGDSERAAATRGFLQANGYTPGYDLRAPLFQQTVDLPDDLPVNAAAYPDCQHTAASTQYAYAYRSRVCLYERLYITSGERDPFIQAWAALTVLKKYHDPNHPLPESHWWIQGSTPATISTHLQGQWNRTGQGIPKCTPLLCDELSGIRTSVFGALETELGYHYGDPTARHFADAAAKVTIATQVGAEGTIGADDGHSYFRPGQAGSYMAAWSRDLRYARPSAPGWLVALARWLRGVQPMPSEYDGLTVSNSETSFDALGFLHTYRCARYGVCAVVSK